MTTNTEYQEFAKEVALKAGDIMMKYFSPDIDVMIKDDKTLLTVADEEINQLVITEVEKHFPDHSIDGEEAGVKKDSRLVWVCDPIDGTNPYAKGLAVSAFSLALVDDGVPIVGVVYNPFVKNLYTAIKGEGAYLNDKPIHVSERELGNQATVNVEWWAAAKYDIDKALHDLSLETKLYKVSLSCVVTGACLVASGKYEACVFPGTNGKNVDIAAVKVIVEEAGGKVTNLHGDEQRYDQDIDGALVSNGIVHAQILEAINK